MLHKAYVMIIMTCYVMVGNELCEFDMLLLCLVTLRVWSRAVFVMGATVAVVWLFSLALGVWIGR